MAFDPQKFFENLAIFYPPDIRQIPRIRDFWGWLKFLNNLEIISMSKNPTKKLSIIFVWIIRTLSILLTNVCLQVAIMLPLLNFYIFWTFWRLRRVRHALWPSRNELHKSRWHPLFHPRWRKNSNFPVRFEEFSFMNTKW